MTEKCENQKSFSCLTVSHTLVCCCSLLHPHQPSTHTGAHLAGNMEREGMLVWSIYYGRIGSEATERLLERFGHDGSFLLRDSETMQGAYCLCVRRAPFVYTYRLVHSTDGWGLQQDSGVRLQRFQTLETLIESYRRGTASDVSITPLTDPLYKTQLQYPSLGQEFVYMETCRSGRSVY
ncbi:SH2 domain-containing protein 1A-like isoform X1 [Epinephelus lanceolatus]|uniref:SH2 domain-containing protein 1A-like isoform X1 n=2 Tax=Epinephelus lanceolatus TaxID=310571 RepID=UPI0014475D44|nr:SH2 domain-containing protein 1A-like isoform X1 [Epinephelus lanceolatus]